MKKRLLALALAFVMCLSLLPAAAMAASQEELVDYTRVIMPDDSEYVTVSGVKAPVKGVVKIAAEVEGYPVKTISEEAFANQTELTGIELPATLVTIGDRAFENCTALKSIDFPGALREIGEGAFLGCTSLAEVSLQPGIERCGFQCWEGTAWYESFPEGINYQDGYLVCGKGNALGAVTVPEGTHSILSGALYDNSSITSISLPSSLQLVGAGAFENCHRLSRVQGLEYPVKLGNDAFAVSALQGEIRLNPEMEQLSKSVFYGCSNLTGVRLSAGLKVIGEQAFRKCTSLRQIELPQGLEEIGYLAFGETGLQSITIPASVRVLGDGAFADNYELAQIDAEGFPEVLGRHVFEHSMWVEHCWDGPVYFQDWLIDFNGEMWEDYVLDIKPGTKLMAEKYAEGMQGLTEVSIPGSLSRVSKRAFAGCPDLRKVTLKDGVQCIGEEAFGRCTALNDVSMANSVTEMEGTAFSECTALKTIRLSENLKAVAYATFGDCSNLESVSISDRLETVENLAFAGCGKLREIDLGPQLREIGWAAFSDCIGLESVRFRGPAPKLYRDSFSGVHARAHYNATDPTWDTELVARNTGAEFTWEADIPQGALDAPDMKTNGVKLWWQAVPGAHHYEIWVSRGGAMPCTKTGETTGTEFTDTEAAPGSTYRYHVQAIGGDGRRGACSNVIEQRLIMEDPKVTGSIDPATGLPTLRWDSVPGAVGYSIRTFDETTGNFEGYSYVKGTSYVHQAAAPGHRYGYQVKAANDLGEWSDWSEMVYLTASEARPNVRVELNSSGKPVLRWEEVPGAASYEVERRAGADGSFAHLYNAHGTSLTNGSAKPGVEYFYRVRILAEDGTPGAWSEIVSATCILARPNVTVSARSDGKPVLTWNKIDGAVKYEVYVSTDGGDFVRLTSVNGTKLNHTSAKPGHTYAYKVRTLAAKSAANSAWSAEAAITVEDAAPALSAPTLTAANNRTTGKPYLKWNKVDGAAKYEVCRATSKSGTYTPLWSGSGTALTNGSAKAGTTYYYKVRAIASNGTKGPWSTIKTRTCDLVQPDVKVTIRSDGKPVLTWQKVSGAVKYEVYRRVDGGDFSRLSTVNGTKLTNSSAKSGHTYTYRVRAIAAKSAANSSYSYYDTVTVK